MAIVNLVRYSGINGNPIYYNENLALVDLSAGNASPNHVLTRLIFTGHNQTAIISETGIPEYQPNTRFTFTVWVKQESWTGDFQIGLVNDSNSGVVTYYNFSNTTDTALTPSVQTFGADAPWSSATASATFLEGGWVKISVSGVTPPTTGLVLKVLLDFGDTTVATGASFLIDGLALYQGTETTFVKTTTAPRGSGFLPQFTFPNHKTGIRYPQDSTAIQLGGGYVFAARPVSPPQRTFILTFAALFWCTDINGNIDLLSRADVNVGALDAFYQTVRLWQTFNYNHPMYGPIAVKFAKPLDIPPPETGGFGAVFNLTVELIEQP